MKSKAALLVGVLALFLGGCDRSDQRPASTAVQERSSSAPALRADAGGPPDAARPDPTAEAPRADSQRQQEPPVQGQADARQGEQKQHFDNNEK